MLEVRRWRELVADRKKMEGHCSTGQSTQWVVVLMEEDVLDVSEDGGAPVFRIRQFQEEWN